MVCSQRDGEALSSDQTFQYLTLYVNGRTKSLHLDPSDCLVVRVEACDAQRTDTASGQAAGGAGGKPGNVGDSGSGAKHVGAPSGAAASNPRVEADSKRRAKEFHGIVVSGASPAHYVIK